MNQINRNDPVWLSKELRDARRANDVERVLTACDGLLVIVAGLTTHPQLRPSLDLVLVEPVREALRWAVNQLMWSFESAVEFTRATHGAAWFDLWWENSPTADREGEQGMVWLNNEHTPYDSRRVAVHCAKDNYWVYVFADRDQGSVKYLGNHGRVRVPSWAVNARQATRIANLARLLPKQPQAWGECKWCYGTGRTATTMGERLRGDLRTCTYCYGSKRTPRLTPTCALRLYIDALMLAKGDGFLEWLSDGGKRYPTSGPWLNLLDHPWGTRVCSDGRIELSESGAVSVELPEVS